MSDTWSAPPPAPRLGEGAIHVWRLRPELLVPEVERLRVVLAPDEQERAARFAFPEDRHGYVVGRGMLRVILGRYLGQNPEGLRFRASPAGKPFLEEATDCGLRFNLSHSGGLVLLAVAAGREVGVDLERIRGNVDGPRIARRFFLPSEVEGLERLPQECRKEAFFAVWTRKEALLKAVGEGLRLSLAHFEVSVDPDAPAAVLSQQGQQNGLRWSLRDLEVGPGYRAALAAEGPLPPPETWEAELTSLDLG